MDEWFVRGAIWVAMAAWTYGIVCGKVGCNPTFSSKVPWLVGLSFYFIHIILAYGVFYDWSHAVAWDETALDTAAATGVRTGIGLLLNFFFGGWLVWDLFRRITDEIGSARYVTEGLVFFFLLNGAIVFGSGPVVVFGAVLCLAILSEWIFRRRRLNDV